MGGVEEVVTGEVPRGIMFSYVDDLTITVGSLSYRRNCQLFQHLYSVLKRRGARIGLSFTVAKTELCHWRMPKDRDPTSRAVVGLGCHSLPSLPECSMARLLVHAIDSIFSSLS